MSIFLACVAMIDEFGVSIIKVLGKKAGKRCKVECFSEIVFEELDEPSSPRPDGLIIVNTGRREWRALVEAKIGKNSLDAEQIERYRDLALRQKIDCVLTISNQFATHPHHHPIESVRTKKSKVPVFHLSWMYILTEADLLIQNDRVKKRDQSVLLREFRRFLSHESAGVRGFDRMPAQWVSLNKLVSAGGVISTSSAEAITVVEAWHQETKDLSLILSRQTEAAVTEKLPTKHRQDPVKRRKDELNCLKEDRQLKASLLVPDAASNLDVVADLARRTVDVGMTIAAPVDRVSSRARLNWLLRQISDEVPDDLQIRMNWPGKLASTQFAYSELSADPRLINRDRVGKQVTSFDVFVSRRFGSRFVQQLGFVAELETVVPEFYKLIGQNLTVWQSKPPTIKADKETPQQVSVEAISILAETKGNSLDSQ
jgi:hypothetical protein